MNKTETNENIYQILLNYFLAKEGKNKEKNLFSNEKNKAKQYMISFGKRYFDW